MNGERNGKGKDYYENGNLRFEGEYEDGEIKEYNINSILEFEGEFINGKRKDKK